MILLNISAINEGETNSYIWGLDIDLVKSVNTLTINIVATILVAFAAIIVLVSLNCH